MLEENEAQAAKVPSESDIQTQMFISDMLSQVPLLICNVKADPPDYATMHSFKSMRNTNSTRKLKKRSKRKQPLSQSPRANTLSIHTLMSLIKSGWPEDKPESKHYEREYWPYRDELAPYNGLLEQE